MMLPKHTIMTCHPLLYAGWTTLRVAVEEEKVPLGVGGALDWHFWKCEYLGRSLCAMRGLEVVIDEVLLREAGSEYKQ